LASSHHGGMESLVFDLTRIFYRKPFRGGEIAENTSRKQRLFAVHFPSFKTCKKALFEAQHPSFSESCLSSLRLLKKTKIHIINTKSIELKWNLAA
jgi:hypothetical protein